MKQVIRVTLSLILLIGSDTTFPGRPGVNAENLEIQWDHAVYLEGTVGNLEEAIKIYDSIAIATEDKELEAYALLRAAQCYTRLGKNSKAENYYKRLKTEFSENLEIQQALKIAQDFLPDTNQQLLPSPWHDGEVLQYESFDVNNTVTSYTTRVKSKIENENGLQWKTENIKVYALNNDYTFEESISFDKENRFARYKNHYLGNMLVELTRVNDKLIYGEPTKGISYQYENSDSAYLVNDVIDVIRRLPLNESFLVQVPVFGAQDLSPYQARIEVIATDEDVNVPAGQFITFHVKVSYWLNKIVFREEDYWVSENESRLIVKSAIGDKTTKLTNYRSTSANNGTDYNLSNDLTIKLPPRWLLYGVKGRALDAQTFVLIPFNGQSVAQYGINTAAREDWESVSLEQLAKESIAWAGEYYIDYHTRQKSLRTVQVGDHRAIRYISDYKSSLGEETEDRTIFPMRSGKYAYHIVFYSSAEGVINMQKDHDYIINNLIKINRDKN